jgi:cytochrome c553
MLSKKISVKTILITLLTLGGAGAIIGVLVIALGLPSVSARAPHMKITTYLLHTVFKQSVSARADVAAPEDLLSPGRVKLGAQHYANVCSKCHGGPGLGQNPIALSMRPRPQHLPAVVDQFSDEEIYVILRDGVRFSAMPAWPTTGNLDEIWSLVAFLRELPEMDAATYADMVTTDDEGPNIPYGAPGELAEVDVGIKAPPMEEYLYAAPATGWPDLAQSEHPVQRCAACHGADGSGSATDGRAPNLTLQSASYITDALEAYATGQRASGIMQVVASGLTNDQMKALGDYYENLPTVQADADVDGTVDLARAADIAHNGLPQEAVAGCLNCHQRDTTDSGISAPNIAGQSAVYIANQLHAFATGARGNVGSYHPMQYEASSLTRDDINSLAAYFQDMPTDTKATDVTMTQPSGDVAKGQETANLVCSKCHEPNFAGVSSGQFPNLTLQTPEYITQQLRSFRADKRKNERMLQTARLMEDGDIANVAAYLGTQQPLPTPGTFDVSLLPAGQKIAENGVPSANIPACLSCHGTQSVSNLPLVPRLQGQNENYIKNRLDYFARGSSLPLPGLNPMHQYAVNLTEQQRAEVAAYFAGQTVVPK